MPIKNQLSANREPNVLLTNRAWGVSGGAPAPPDHETVTTESDGLCPTDS